MRGHRYALRTKPGDFVVEELPDCKPGGHGAFGIYILKKSGLDTTAALRIIATRTNVPFQAIGCAGLNGSQAGANPSTQPSGSDKPQNASI